MAETLIAVEGLDGAGKSTQVAMLASALSTVDVVSFPRYDTFFGRQIRLLLDGTGGVSAQTVDPRSMALWYALDRAQWARDRKPVSDGVVLLNRYTLSNAVYQSARADPALFDWVLHLEFEELELPQPDVTVVLDVPPDVSQRRVAHRGDAEGDVYERSAALLARVREGYLAAADRLPDVVVVSAAGSPPDVHAAVLSALSPFLPGSA
ncbi:MAG: dTMP kinase [Actinobacteria bacterium 13_2_20CM_2_71_6]|nr:MAG: dTMP kinase [Actinobacteria bacterium 13_2_20CM_2_71_6]